VLRSTTGAVCSSTVYQESMRLEEEGTTMELGAPVQRYYYRRRSSLVLRYEQEEDDGVGCSGMTKIDNGRRPESMDLQED
jgi:hypothetical protein